MEMLFRLIQQFTTLRMPNMGFQLLIIPTVPFPEDWMAFFCSGTYLDSYIIRVLWGLRNLCSPKQIQVKGIFIVSLFPIIGNIIIIIDNRLTTQEGEGYFERFGVENWEVKAIIPPPGGRGAGWPCGPSHLCSLLESSPFSFKNKNNLFFLLFFNSFPYLDDYRMLSRIPCALQ